ncbi:MAG: ParB/RepB/Spo0J family partition protein [Actinomycetota bacterium]|nr:ParB/RepB/Spo0J family partition protein [Actinomycetota bacterium]
MAGRKSGLGRGLEALIPSGTEGHEGLRLIPLEHIVPNPHQPRTRFEEEGLASLAASIREVGLLQPVVVRPEDGKFVLVAGERRWRAAGMAGLHEIPALVREGEESGFLTHALVENLQREDLSPLEEAAAFQQLLEDFGWTHEEVGRRVGKSRTAVTNALRLLQLPAAIQGMLERGELSAGHARALLGTEDGKFAAHVARRAVEEGWSVRQVEEAVRVRAGQAPRTRGGPRRARPAPLLELEGRLSEQLGVPVEIDYRGKKGRLTIKFGSLDELERIYRRFLGSGRGS